MIQTLQHNGFIDVKYDRVEKEITVSTLLSYCCIIMLIFQHENCLNIESF